MIKPNPSYTIIILTKNEDSIIGDCIDALPSGIDYFILDSGSTDNTEGIVRAKNANYVNHPMSKFIISEQRNWALKNLPIKTDWVMFLDADEVIPPELHDEIQKKINTDEYNCYRLTPKFIFWGKWMKRLQGFPNWHDRLLRKDKVSIIGGVWEKFDENAKVGYIKVPYDHYANIKGFESWLEKHNRYSTWDAQKSFEYLYKGAEIGSVRKVRLRKLATKLWWFRPWARSIHMYLFRLGFLEGWRAFYLVLLYFFYEYMTVIKIIELKRLDKNKKL